MDNSILCLLSTVTEFSEFRISIFCRGQLLFLHVPAIAQWIFDALNEG